MRRDRSSTVLTINVKSNCMDFIAENVFKKHDFPENIFTQDLDSVSDVDKYRSANKFRIQSA